MKRKLVQATKPIESYSYMKIKLTFETPDHYLYPLFYQQAITIALKKMYGLTGEALFIEFVSIEESKGESILKVYRENVKRIWAALTTMSLYDGVKCRFDVLEILLNL